MNAGVVIGLVLTGLIVAVIVAHLAASWKDDE